MSHVVKTQSPKANEKKAKKTPPKCTHCQYQRLKSSRYNKILSKQYLTKIQHHKYMNANFMYTGITMVQVRKCYIAKTMPSTPLIDNII